MKRLIYRVPDWHVQQHRRERGLSQASENDPPRLQLEDELFEVLFTGGRDALPSHEEHPQAAPWARAVHGMVSALPIFQRLTAECLGKAGLAALAVEALMAGFQWEHGQSPRKLRRALRQAWARADAAIRQLQEAMEGFEHVQGFGHDQGVHRTTPGMTVRFLASRIRNDARLRDIAMLTGRFKRIIAAKKRQRVRHGADEVTDIMQGGDLARLLPVELARFRHPLLRLALLRDIIERQCLQYQLSGTEVLGKGPLVVCLDKSSSMDGSRDTWATAVALALLDTAQRERRPFALLCFDTEVTHEAIVTTDGQLPEESLFVSCSGGTDIAEAVKRGLDIIATHRGQLRKADIVLVTDGESEREKAPALRARADTLGATILGFGIGINAQQLAPWCDSPHVVRSLDTLDEATAEVVADL